ncbi:hypothetical protein ACTFIW_004456 [Dictyostelium discoideum]
MNLAILRQPPTQREIYTIIYDISCPHIPGYQKLQKSNYQKECTLLVVTDEAYSLHLEENLSWLPICVQRMHIHRVITEKSIYPLQYDNTQNNNGEGFEEDNDEMLQDEEFNNY